MIRTTLLALPILLAACGGGGGIADRGDGSMSLLDQQRVTERSLTTADPSAQPALIAEFNALFQRLTTPR